MVTVTFKLKGYNKQEQKMVNIEVNCAAYKTIVHLLSSSSTIGIVEILIIMLKRYNLNRR